ncbi:hypothetical protein GALMADRAFT_76622 [Galerina marginata CBS 339.88]|uniref:Uncharacterized protein n=1 Tax=Galerina marginata (strain CBS 339.88) TaxID=685588 RepID=A0A067STF8_GALM3|nr:hypothetical protein GALMADRAFT_76622 [Galerina marginata CBS 339.88]
MQDSFHTDRSSTLLHVPFGVTYEKIGTIQRRLAWPLHKDDTLSRSGRSTDLNIYFSSFLPSLKNAFRAFKICSFDIFCSAVSVAGNLSPPERPI